jgi:putative copper export protein
LGTAILWIHAAAAAVWIGACACFAIAGLAVPDGSDDQRNFVANTAPRINQLGLAAASVLFATGVINLAVQAVSRRFAFSTAFVIVLASKIFLFIAMTLLLTRTMRVGSVIRAVLERGPVGSVPTATSQMVRFHLAIAAMGAFAMILGLWLVGS